MSPVVQAAIDQMNATQGVVQSAVILINSINSRIAAAVQAALDLGATAEQLAPVSAEVAETQAATDALSAAIAANP